MQDEDTHDPAKPAGRDTAQPFVATRPDYEAHSLEWRGQSLTVRWCPQWSGDLTAHLEIVSSDRRRHPISETGYRSHFVPRAYVEEAGGPAAYVAAWLKEIDDGAPVQLSLF
jgi:hypothetical protein